MGTLQLHGIEHLGKASIGWCLCGRKSLTRYVFDPDSRPSFDALMAALVTQGSSLDWSYLEDLWTMACASILPYQSKMWGCGIYFISRVWGGVLSRLLLLFTRSAALFPSYFLLLACLIHSFTFIHLLSSVVRYSFAGVCSQDTLLRSLESFALG